MGQTFKQKYHDCQAWHEKVIVMEIFHLTMRARDKTWTVRKTAEQFECSVGLVSENLQLAELIHNEPKLAELPDRKSALLKLRSVS